MDDVMFGTLFFVIIGIGIASVFLHFVPIGLWISALAADVHVGIFTLIGMRMRRVPPAKIVMPLIKANKAGLDVNVNQLEAHYLAGGNVDKVVDALIASQRAQIVLPFERSAAIDLAGRDVLEAVQMSVNPKVIETPVVSAVAKNGIELKIKARVTVRANIDRLVGGAGEPTIIARVGEGIVTTVGSSEMHTDVLESPDDISRRCWAKVWTLARRLKSYRLTLRTLTLAGISAHNFRLTKPRQISESLKLKRKSVAQWQSLKNRK